MRDEFAPLGDDFQRSTTRAIESLQEMGPREIKQTVLFLGSRWGTVCTTDENGVPQIISTAAERDAQGREIRQRFFIGARVEALSKDRTTRSDNLRKRRMPKSFMITSQADQMLQAVIPTAQDEGDNIQRKIDEQNFEWFPSFFEEPRQDTVSKEDEPDPDIDLIKKLTSTAYGIVTESLGGKAEKVEVSLAKWTESWIVADSRGTKVDVLIPRARLSILVKTRGGSEAFGCIGGSCGKLKDILARYIPKPEDVSPEKLSRDPDITNTDPFIISARLAKRVVREAIDLDRAQNSAIVGNECPVILSSQAAGVFVHEVLGHTSEGDIICENRRDKSAQVQLKSLLGAQVSDHRKFNVVDTPDPVLDLGNGRKITYNWGSLPDYDEYGVKTKSTILIKQGIRVGAFLNHLTYNEVVAGLKDDIAEAMRTHGLSGNSRSEKYDSPAILRMRNTFILPDDEGLNSAAEMAKLIPANQKGVYVKSVKGGWVDTKNGTYMVEGNLCYLIENGTITDKPIKGVKITGNVTKFQSTIKAIGTAQTMRYTFIGWCGKNNQWVPVDGAGPIILLDKISIAGGSHQSWTKVVEEYDRQHREVFEGKRSPLAIHIDTVAEVLGPGNSQTQVCLVTAFLPFEQEVKIIMGMRCDKATHETSDDGTTAMERKDIYADSK